MITSCLGIILCNFPLTKLPAIQILIYLEPATLIFILSCIINECINIPWRCKFYVVILLFLSFYTQISINANFKINRTTISNFHYLKHNWLEMTTLHLLPINIFFGPGQKINPICFVKPLRKNQLFIKKFRWLHQKSPAISKYY